MTKSSVRLKLGLAVAVVLLVGVVAEIVGRAEVARRFAAGASGPLQVRPDIGLGSAPALLHLAQECFPQVTLTTDAASFRRLGGVAVEARLTNVRPTGGQLAVDHSDVTAEVPSAALAEAISHRLGTVVQVAADPASGSLTMRTGPAGMVAVGVRPVLTGSAVRFEPVSAAFGGTPLPERFADQAVEQLRPVELSDLPLALKPDALSVTETGLRLQLSGDHATLRA